MYILFTIISPVVSKIAGTNLDNLDFDYEKYFEQTDTYQTMSESLANNNDKTVEEIYQTNLKNDMKNKLSEKGYIASDIQIQMELEDSDNYGRITSITLTIAKKKNMTQEDSDNVKENTVETIAVNQVETVTINNTTKENTSTSQEESKETVKSSEINEIKSYLSNVYDVNKKQIKVNKKGG